MAAAAFVAMLAAPMSVYAQENQQPAARSYGHTNPSQARLQHRWTKRFGHLNLSGDQQQRMQSIINQYSQAHPEGSPRDRGAARELHHQLMSVLSSDQQNQYRQEMRARRAQSRQRAGQMQQGPGAQNDQGAPDQRYQQGPSDQQYQQGPSDQQYQQGPQSAVPAGSTRSAVPAGSTQSAVPAGSTRSAVPAGSTQSATARLTACVRLRTTR